MAQTEIKIAQSALAEEERVRSLLKQELENKLRLSLCRAVRRNVVVFLVLGGMMSPTRCRDLYVVFCCSRVVLRGVDDRFAPLGVVSLGPQ